MSVELPLEFYKYPSGVQQIQAEADEQFVMNEMGTDLNGDALLITLHEGMYPYKNFSLPESLFRANMVKSLFIESIKIFSKWYFIPGVLLSWKERHNILRNSFNRIAFRIVSDKILKERHWSKFARAFHFVIFRFLERMGFVEEEADKFAEIFVFMIDADNAYRLRIEDTFSASSREKLIANPRKEVKRLAKVFMEREGVNVATAKKFGAVATLLSLILLIPKVKRAFITTFQECDYANLCLDTGDEYWSVIRTDHNFLGMNYQQRQEYAKLKGWTYPQPINNMKKINEQQIQQILQTLQKVNTGIQDYVAIQTMLATLPAELPKIPEQTISNESK